MPLVNILAPVRGLGLVALGKLDSSHMCQLDLVGGASPSLGAHAGSETQPAGTCTTMRL